jgi:hypothetical protein
MTKKAVGRPGPAPATPVSDRRLEAAARRGQTMPAARPAAGPKHPGPKQADTAPTPARPVAQASTAKPATSTRIKVQATKMGYYGHERRRVGDVFLVQRAQFNPSWMTVTEAGTKLQRTTGREELRRKHDEILSMKNADRITTSEHEVENTGDNPLDAD